MAYIWTYLIVALCAVVTSAGVMDFPGNRNSFQDNLDSDVKYEKFVTPPPDSGLIIDSNGYPGNSNEEKAELEELSNDFSEIFGTFQNENNYDLSKYEVIPFSKEDFSHLKNSNICKMLCKAGIAKPPCSC